MAQANNLSELFPTLLQVLEAYGKALVENYRQGLKDGNHIATGNLYNSVKSYVNVDGKYFEVDFEMPDYGEYLEEGTRPHFPPTDAIENWIRVKRIVPRRDDQGKLPTEKQLAFLISRKISEDGTKGTHLFERANALTFNDWSRLIDQAVETDITNNLAAIISEISRKK